MPNLGLAEWLILFVVFAVIVSIISAFRRRASGGMSSDDRLALQRLIDTLERMERRVDNLETIVTRRDDPHGADRPEK